MAAHAAFASDAIRDTREWLAAGSGAVPRGAGLPLVTLTWAQAVDGTMAVSRGSSTAISGPESFCITHALRALHRVILVGVATLIADNPRLNVRCVEGSSPQPVILDTHLRTPPGCKLLTDPTCMRPIIYSRDGHSGRADLHDDAAAAWGERLEALQAAGAQVRPISQLDVDGRPEVLAVLRDLCARGVDSVMVEGGASVLRSFLRALSSVESTTLACPDSSAAVRPTAAITEVEGSTLTGPPGGSTRVVITLAPRLLLGSVNIGCGSESGRSHAINAEIAECSCEMAGKDVIMHGWLAV